MVRKEVINSIATSIKTRRLLLGMSLDEVAERAGITKSHVWSMEKGRSTNPTIWAALAMCDALSLSLNDLLGLDVSQPHVSANELALIRAHRDIFGAS